MAFDFGSGLSGASGGAQTGMMMGGPWGAAIGGAIGFVGGGMLGGKASKKDKRLKRQQKVLFAEMMGMMRATRKQADDHYKHYTKTFKPVEQLLGEQAQSGMFTAPESVQRAYRDRASADVIHAFAKQRGITEREMAKAGVDPSEGRYLGDQRKMAVKEGATEAGAMTQAGRQADLDVTAQRMDFARMGKGYADLAMKGMSSSFSQAGTMHKAVDTERARNMQAVQEQAGAFMPHSTDSYNRPGTPGINPEGSMGGRMDLRGMGSFEDGGMAYAHGGAVEGPSGAVEGPGGPVDDQVPANLPPNSYVIPADVVEALGVEYFDRLEGQNSGTAGAEGAQGKVNALLSSGEYVISEATVKIKGKKFFDTLVEKYHKPAAQQTEEYQSDNKGAAPGEAVQAFEGAKANGGYAEGGAGYIDPNYDPLDRTQAGAGVPAPAAPALDMDRFKALQAKFKLEQEGGDRMSMDDMLEFNELQDTVSKADGGGWFGGSLGGAGAGAGAPVGAPDQGLGGDTRYQGQGYDSPGYQAAMAPSSWGTKQTPQAYAAAKPQEIGTFGIKPGVDRMTKWKAMRANRLGTDQQARDMTDYQGRAPAPAAAPVRELRSGRADGGQAAFGKKKKTRRGGRKNNKKKLADGGKSKEEHKKQGTRPKAGDTGPAPKPVTGTLGGGGGVSKITKTVTEFGAGYRAQHRKEANEGYTGEKE